MNEYYWQSILRGWQLSTDVATLKAENERLRVRLEHAESEHARETRNGFDSWRTLRAENERLRAKLAAAEAYGEKERRHFEDWFKRAEQAEARIRALEAALRDLLSYTFETTVPPTIIDNARAALTEPTPPQGDECHCGHCRYVRASEPTPPAGGQG